MRGAVAHFQLHAVDYQKKMLKYSKTNPIVCKGPWPISPVILSGHSPEYSRYLSRSKPAKGVVSTLLSLPRRPDLVGTPLNDSLLLQHGQVLIDFVVSDFCAVGVPFDTFVFYQLVKNMLAECLFHQR